ncbi:protein DETOXIFICATION [Trifolium repens]|nr:protein DETOXIFICATION [Trifolium repens]KAK2389674.1 protein DETOXIFICATION [Trifolium repens]
MDDSTQPLSQPNQKKNTMKLTQPIPFPTNHHPTPQYSLRQHPTWSQSPAQETSHNISLSQKSFGTSPVLPSSPSSPNTPSELSLKYSLAMLVLSTLRLSPLKTPTLLASPSA